MMHSIRTYFIIKYIYIIVFQYTVWWDIEFNWFCICIIAHSTSGGLQHSAQWLCHALIGFFGPAGIGHSLHLQVQTVNLNKSHLIMHSHFDMPADPDKCCTRLLLLTSVSSWYSLLGLEWINASVFSPQA